MNTNETPDCISGSLCFVKLGYADADNDEWQNDSLARDEVERNYLFYMLKKDEKLRKKFQDALGEFQGKEANKTLNPTEKYIFQRIKPLDELLNSYASTYKNISEELSTGEKTFKVEEVIKHKDIQSVLDKLERSFSALTYLNQTDYKELRDYAEVSLLCIKNLKRINIDGQDTIRCLFNTSKYRKEQIEDATNASQEFEKILKNCDDRNIALFSVDALYHHYKFFVHGLDGNASVDNQPRDHCVDDRLIVLSPKDTVLFFSNFHKLNPVPNSYAGRDKVNAQEDRTGISGIIPQLSGAFIRARVIDSDIRPQEFLDILRRSGSISLTQRDNGAILGGVIPNFKQLEQNVKKWKEMRMRLDPTPYTKMNTNQRKERIDQFQKCLDILNEQAVTISYFGKDTTQYSQRDTPKSAGIVLQRTENTTYGEYLRRPDKKIMEAKKFIPTSLIKNASTARG